MGWFWIDVLWVLRLGGFGVVLGFLGDCGVFACWF